MTTIRRHPLLTLAPLVFLPGAALAQAPTLFYDFEGGSLLNLGTLGGTGTAFNFNGNEAVGGAPGGATPGGGLRLDQDGAADAGGGVGSGEFLRTNHGAAAIGFDAGDYTAAAWVNLDNGAGDNMVFGQTAAPFLHNGIRDNKLHMGHWGADTTSALTVSNGTWNHLAWTQLTPASFGAGAPANAQFLYLNGFIVGTSGSGTLANAGNVVIGSSGNNGGLLGTIDDVAAYSDPLRPNQVQYLAGGGSPLTVPAATGYLPAVLPGPMGAPGVFGVLEVRGNAGMNHIDAAVSALQPGNPSASGHTTGTVPAVNFVDPTTNPTAGSFGGDIPFLTDTGADDNNIALVAKGTINVPASGNYSFRVRGDDGFALRIQGQSWTGVSGGGGLDPLDPQTMYFAGGTGDSNTTGTVTLPQGSYHLEFVGFEGGGGAHQEIAVAFNGGPFSLVGAPATVVNTPGVTAAGWSVTTSLPGGTALNNIADGQADLANNPGASASGVASINYNDATPPAGAGSIGGDIPFPNDVAGTDDNDFAVLSQATLVIPFDGVYRFGFQGDDGSYLRIAGVSGWTLIENVAPNTNSFVADSNGVANPAGDTLWKNELTGNSRMIGEISLLAGTYPIEGLFFERGGGANWEIFGSGGDTNYTLLTAGGASSATTAGVLLVPEPSSMVMLLAAGGFLLRRKRK